MPLIINAEAFVPSASGALDTAIIADQFHEAMDIVLLTMGRDITLHLPPTKSRCLSSDCVFNSFYKRYVNAAGQVCENCKGEGFVIEPRYTVYRANIRWADEAYNEARSIQESQPYGRLGVDFVRTKTVATSFDHVKQSQMATIDGLNVQLHEEPRYTGFAGELFYVVAWWKKVNK